MKTAAILMVLMMGPQALAADSYLCEANEGGTQHSFRGMRITMKDASTLVGYEEGRITKAGSKEFKSTFSVKVRISATKGHLRSLPAYSDYNEFLLGKLSTKSTASILIEKSLKDQYIQAFTLANNEHLTAFLCKYVRVF